MKNLFTYLLVTLLMLGNTVAFAQKTVKASKVYITKKVENVGSFDHLTLKGSPCVIYTQKNSGTPQIEIYGSDNIVPLIETFVKDGTLTIQYKKNTYIQNNGKLEIRVSGPALKSMKVNGSGDIKIPKGMNASSLKLIVQGSGDINGKNITCDELDMVVKGSGDIYLQKVEATVTNAKVHGSGDIQLDGTGRDANYTVQGSGDIQASKMKAENVQAHVNGSGDIACHASETLSGKVTGSGDVGYKGNPEISFSKKGLHKL